MIHVALSASRSCALLADIDAGTLRIVIAIVVMTIYGLNSMLSKMNKAKQKQLARPIASRPRAPAATQDVQHEVNEFLKRAAEKRVVRAEPARRDPPKRLVEIGGADVVEAQVIPDEPPTGAGVAQHVRQHLDTREFSSRASHLSTVEAADEAIESHLHQVFAHQLGSLSSRTAGSSTAADSPAAANTTPATSAAESLLAMLSNPQNVRSAVVLSEILERPIDRWTR
jgi:hypothetical protein